MGRARERSTRLRQAPAAEQPARVRQVRRARQAQSVRRQVRRLRPAPGCCGRLHLRLATCHTQAISFMDGRLVARCGND